MESTTPARAKGYIVTHSLSQEQIKTAITVTSQSPFATAIIAEFKERKPRKVIETGTFEGNGTTRIIHMAALEAGVENLDFWTMECNPNSFSKALNNIVTNKLNVRALFGVSVPRRILPSQAEIQKICVDTVYDGVFIDHFDHNRAEMYFRESNNPFGPDDLLGLVLDHFQNRPDFVLLDSAGHMGFIEFQYLLSKLQGPCTIACDDTGHFKHYKSLLTMKSDPRFKVLAEGTDKFGWAVSRFEP
jgi:hypothetical protein